MSNGVIKSSELIDATGILNDLSRINIELKEMIQSLAVDLKKTIPVLNGLKINNSQSIKDMNQAMKEANSILQQQIQLQSLQSKTEKEIDAAKIRSLKIEQEKQKLEKESIKTKSAQTAEANKEQKAREKANKEIEKSNDLYGKESKRLNDLRKEYKNLVLSEGDATEKTKKLGAEILQLDAKLKKVDASVGQFQRNVGNYPKTSFLTTTFGVLSGNLLTRGLSAITSTIKSTIQLNKEFESSLANLSAITGATGKDLEFYKNQAKLLGQTTKGGAVAVVEAFKLIGSAKPELLASKEDLAGVTKQAILLSKAAGLELPDAATRLTDALNQFGAPAKDAGKFVDILAAGAKAGAAEVPEVTDALLKFGVAAKSSNISIQESVAAIELLAEKGLKGAEAGTALRNVFAKLSAAKILPPEAQRELKQAGVDIRVLADNSLPLNVRLKELSKIEGNAAAITRVFGLENKTAGEVLIANIPRLNDLTKAVDENGVATEQAATNTDTYEQAVSNLGGAFDTLILNLTEGNSFLKTFISNAAEGLQNLNRELALTAEIEEKIGKNDLPSLTSSLISGKNQQTRDNIAFFNQQLKEQNEEINNLEGGYVDIAKAKLRLNILTDDEEKKLVFKSKKEKDAYYIKKEKDESEIKQLAKRISLEEKSLDLEQRKKFADEQRAALPTEGLDKLQTNSGALLALSDATSAAEAIKGYQNAEKLKESGAISEEQYSVQSKLLKKELSDLDKGIIVEKKKQTKEEQEAQAKLAEETAKALELRLKAERKALAEKLKAEQDFRDKIRQLQINAIVDEKERAEAQAKFNTEKEIRSVEASKAGKDAKKEYELAIEKDLKDQLEKIQEDFDKKAEEKIQEKHKKDFEIYKAQRKEGYDFEIETQKANFDKEKDLKAQSDKTINDKELADLIDLLNKIKEKRLEALTSAYEFEKINSKEGSAERIALDAKYELDKKRILQDELKSEADLKKEARDLQLTADTDALAKRKQLLFDYLNKAVDLAQQEIAKTAALKQAALDKEVENTQRNISIQQALAERGQANTLAFEEANLAKEQLRKEQLKAKELKDQKALAFIKLLAGYAEKDPNTALQKALIDTALASVIAGAFKDGVENFDGEGTGTSDSNLIRFSKGESVATAKATKENPGLITAMNSGNLDSFIEKTYLPNYAMNLNSENPVAKNLYESAQLNQLMSLNKRIESLEKTLRDKPVPNNNLNALGDVINQTVKDGFMQVNVFKKKPVRI